MEKRGGRDVAGGCKVRPDAARWRKTPILGLIQRGGQVVLHMLPNVRQVTIQPIIADTVAPGSLIHTDKYDIYARLPAWGYKHKTVCHAQLR